MLKPKDWNQAQPYKNRRRAAGVVIGLAFASGLLTSGLTGRGEAQASEGDGYAPARFYDVQPGDSPWRVALKALRQKYQLSKVQSVPAAELSELTAQIKDSVPEFDYAHANGGLQKTDEIVLSPEYGLGEEGYVAQSLEDNLPLVVPLGTEFKGPYEPKVEMDYIGGKPYAFEPDHPPLAR